MQNRTIIKIVLWIILGIVLFIGVCIFPYPALFMGNSLPKQPKLSSSEMRYFDKLKKENPWSKISRMYINVDSLGQDIMVRNIPIDFSSKFIYTIRFWTEDTVFYFANNSSKQALSFAKYIKDSICFNTPNLIEIDLSIRYDAPNDKSGNSDLHEFYQFLLDKDSLYLAPRGY